jgi:hypothetical protein
MVLEDDLRQLLRDRPGSVVWVIGTGVPQGALRGTPSEPYTSWAGLLRSGLRRIHELGKLTSRELDDHERLLDHDSLATWLLVAELIAQTLGAPASGEFRRWLRETVGDFEKHLADPAADRAVLDALADHQRCGGLLTTTNYDFLLETVTGLPAATWRTPADVERALRGDEPQVLHLHGAWRWTDSVVLGIRTYDEVVRDPHARAVLTALRTGRTFVFVGCGAGLRDPNLGCFISIWKDSSRKLSRSDDVKMAYRSLMTHLHASAIVLLACCSPKEAAESSSLSTMSAESSAMDGTEISSSSESTLLTSTENPTAANDVTTMQDTVSTDTTGVEGGTPWDPESCDPWQDTCPSEQKCLPFHFMLSTVWDGVGCFPSLPDPDSIGGACRPLIFEQGLIKDLDTCAHGAICDNGICAPLCQNTPEEPHCPPSHGCAMTDFYLALCLPSCYPLEMDCPDGHTCIDTGFFFQCVQPVAGGSAVFEDCVFEEECLPGLWCAPKDIASECSGSATGRCCNEFCELDSDLCSGQGQACEAYYPEPLYPEYETLGTCRQP